MREKAERGALTHVLNAENIREYLCGASLQVELVKKIAGLTVDIISMQQVRQVSYIFKNPSPNTSLVSNIITNALSSTSWAALRTL